MKRTGLALCLALATLVSTATAQQASSAGQELTNAVKQLMEAWQNKDVAIRHFT